MKPIFAFALSILSGFAFCQPDVTQKDLFELKNADLTDIERLGDPAGAARTESFWSFVRTGSPSVGAMVSILGSPSTLTPLISNTACYAYGVTAGSVVAGSSQDSNGNQVPVTWATTNSPQNRLRASQQRGTFFDVNGTTPFAVGEDYLSSTSPPLPVWWKGDANPARLLPLISGADSGSALSINGQDPPKAVGWCKVDDDQIPVIWTYDSGSGNWSVAELSGNSGRPGVADHVTESGGVIGHSAAVGGTPAQMFTWTSGTGPVWFRDFTTQPLPKWGAPDDSYTFALGYSSRPFQWRGILGSGSGFFRDLNAMNVPTGVTVSNVGSCLNVTGGFAYICRGSDGAVYVGEQARRSRFPVAGQDHDGYGSGYKVTRGTTQSGGASDLDQYDGTSLSVARGLVGFIGDYPAVIEYITVVNDPTPESLLVRVVGSVRDNTGAPFGGVFDMVVEIWNWDTSTWSLTTSTQLLTPEKGLSILIGSSDAPHYISDSDTPWTDKTVRWRVRYRAGIVPNLNTWYAHNDQAICFVKTSS